MKKHLLQQLSTASFLEDQGLQYGYLLSLFRYILQAAAYSSYEAAYALVECPEQMQEQAVKLLQPSDGDFTSTLDLCIPALRTIWPSCASGWFDSRGTEYSESGSELCNAIISKRNDRIGHGVFDAHSLHEQLEKLPARIEDLINILDDLLPDFVEHSPGNRVAQLPTPARPITIEVLREQQGKPVLIRRIEHRGSVWRIKGQVLSHTNSSSVLIEVSDSCGLLSDLNPSTSQLMSRNIKMKDGIWRTSVLMPMRQTRTFEGRSAEIVALLEWWEDEDSRASLLYGEGGIGKTTLVLEFLHGLLDSPSETLSWRPALIFFYSAKLTRWGVTGLEQIGGINANVNEALRSLARILEERLTRDWQTEDSRSLISKTSTLFKDAGLGRESILIVLDNTETLARSATEEVGLGKVLREVSTKIGKLLITSRRRESLEAMQIQVPPMTEEVGASLLEKLADTYSALAIQSAGEARRKKISRQFGGKPILLDVLARHIANTNCSIDDGLNAILSQERGDLGAFLFEDAWKRMELSYREVFLALGQLGGSVSEQLLNWACAEFTCYAPNWLTAFEETRFGSIVDYGTNFDITLDSGAREFLAAKYESSTPLERQKISSAVGRVRKKNLQAISAAEERVSDRVAAAFQTTAAKAAKLAAARRDVEGAIRWYEEATIVDSANAALFDRFAWYLMVNDRLDKASLISRKATYLAPNDSDCHFTAGMIAARMADIVEADKALDMAQRLGKASYLVTLQKARARLEKALLIGSSSSKDRGDLLTEAVRLINSANPSGSARNNKHEVERSKLLRRCNFLLEGRLKLNSQN